jgi:AraC-like DNA-binding protein
MRQGDGNADRPRVDSASPTGSRGSATGTLGILQPVAGLERFRLSRTETPPDLQVFAPWFWTVEWDLGDGETHEQEVLPFPCVNLAYEQGEYRVHGPGTQRFVARLSGRGWVTGVRFTPAGFCPFSRVPMRELVDRVLPAREVLRGEPPRASSPEQARGRLGAYLLAQGAVCTEAMALVDRLVAKAQSDPSLVRVELLASQAGVSARSLHRLFERHVGVNSKWVVRRARVQEAAERVARGADVDWAAVAQELGYHDQAHLIRDFRAQVGETPAAYAKRCRQSLSQADRGRG